MKEVFEDPGIDHSITLKRGEGSVEP